MSWVVHQPAMMLQATLCIYCLVSKAGFHCWFSWDLRLGILWRWRGGNPIVFCISQSKNAHGHTILGKKYFLSSFLFGYILESFIFGDEERLCGQRDVRRR